MDHTAPDTKAHRCQGCRAEQSGIVEAAPGQSCARGRGPLCASAKARSAPENRRVYSQARRAGKSAGDLRGSEEGAIQNVNVNSRHAMEIALTLQWQPAAVIWPPEL